MRDGTLYLQFISDFWSTVWSDRKLHQRATGAQVELLNRLYLQAVREAAPDYIEQLPIFREDFWNLITISELDRVGTTGFVYNLGQNYAAVPFLYNKMYGPTVKLREGTEYFVTYDATRLNRSRIEFTSDPFADPAYPVRFDTDTKTLAFWAPKVHIDEEDLYKLYGHLTGIVQPTSEQYRQLIRGVLALYTFGPTTFLMNAGLNLAAGYPVSREFDKVIGITNTSTKYLIRTQRGLSYEVPLVATLSVAVNTELRPMSTFVTDIQVLDYLSDPDWWKGGPTNEDAEQRIVNFIPASMAPDLGAELRDDPEVIDYLFETYFKFHTFGLRVNTLAVQNFSVLEDFFNLVFDIKPSYTSPYINSFFKVEDVFDSPTDDPEIAEIIELMQPLDTGSDRDDADYWSFGRTVRLNSLFRLNSNPQVVSQTARDLVSLESDFLVEEPVTSEGGPYLLNSLLILGGPAPNWTIREQANIGAEMDLEEEAEFDQDLCSIEVYDEDLLTVVAVVGDTLVNYP